MRQWILTSGRAQSSAHRTSVDSNASTSRSGRRLGPLDLGPSPGQATECRYGGTANDPVRTRSDSRGAADPIAARFIGALRAPHHLIPRDLINVRLAYFADSSRTFPEVREVPIVLQKYFEHFG